MGTTNVAATAVRTLDWLAGLERRIVIPVYQRQYRWGVAGCQRLLDDVLAVADAPADAPADRTHFIGSVLASDAAGVRLLIDGQQRLTTIMLLVAALRDATDDPALADRLDRVLSLDGVARLRPHDAWAAEFERIVLGAGAPPDGPPSRFEENYTYFRSRIAAGDERRLARGLDRLEHVAIDLGPAADAQQIFESLNSKGEPLRDDELIHNHVLMGLGDAEQREFETTTWARIEAATGSAIGEFFRDVVVIATGREVPAAERAVYDAFRARYPTVDAAGLRARAAEWLELADGYRTILDPAPVDPELGGRIRTIAVLGRSLLPVVLLALRDLGRGDLGRGAALDVLDQVESLLIRRLVVGLDNRRLGARIVRAWRGGPDAVERAIARITPSDDRTRIALRYREVPHPSLVLTRILGVGPWPDADLEVDRVAPPAPLGSWSPDGVRRWRDLDDDERHAYRALAPTLGNLVLVERGGLAFGSRPFADKRVAYARSRVADTRAVAGLDAWTTRAMSERGARLAAAFVATWPRRDAAPLDDDGLAPLLDVAAPGGGAAEPYEYVDYRGEHWEVHDPVALYRRVYARMWAERPDGVRAHARDAGGPLHPTRAWRGEWETLGEGAELFVGLRPRDALRETQALLAALGLADEVFVRPRPGVR